MGRIILGLLASLLVICSLPASATAQGSAMDLLLRIPPPPYGTIKKNPSICWILRNRLPVGASMMFTLTDSRSIKPVLEVQIPNSIDTEKNETCDCVNLKGYDIQLEPDIQYRWHISIAQNPESHSRDVVGSGLIKRCPEGVCLTEEMPSRCDRNFALRLAVRRIEYDSASCLCDLIKSSPDDETLRRMLDALMRQVYPKLSPN